MYQLECADQEVTRGTRPQPKLKAVCGIPPMGTCTMAPTLICQHQLKLFLTAAHMLVFNRLAMHCATLSNCLFLCHHNGSLVLGVCLNAK